MKKYFGPILLAVAVVAAGLGISSCAVDVDNVFDSLRGYTDCTINANIQTTKTLADEGGKLTWEGGDALTAVIVAPQGGNPIVRDFTYKTDDNTFHGSASSSVLSSPYNWYLTYPSNSSISSVQSIVNIAEAQTQTGNTNLKHIKNELSPLYGVALNNTGVPSVTMQHVSALLRFKLTNESAGPVTVKEVLFTSEQNIVGKFTADLTKETITWAASGNNGQQVKLTVNEGASIAAGEGAEFTAAVIPFTVPAGGKIKVKVTAVDANNQTIPYYVTYSLANGKEFTAGVRSSINVHFDANHQTDEEQPSTISGYTQVNSEPSDWSGKYIMVSPDKNFIFTGATGTSNKYALQASDWNGEAIVKNCDDYVFEISKVGNNYYLKHNGQYLYCSYTDGDGNTGLAYSTSQQPLNLENFSDGTFGFWMTEQSTQQHLYYKSSDGYFKMGHSYGSSCVYLYKYSEGGVTPVDPTTVEGYQQITSEPSDWSGDYVMVSADKSFIFTGDNGTSNKYQLQSSDWNGDIITKDCAQYVFNISKSGNNYYLKHNNQYLYCSYSGNSSTGMAYSSSQQALNLTMLSNSNFGFWMHEGNYDQYIYYKTADNTNYFKFGGSNNGQGVLLYKYSKGSVTPGPGPDEPTTQSFVKVTSTPSSWDGTYLVVDEASGKAFSFDGTNYAINVTITDGKIALTDQTQHAAVTVSDAGVKHANNTSYEAYDVKTSTGKFVYYSNGAIVIGDTNTKTESSSGSSTTYYYYHTFMLDNNGVQMMSGRHSSGSSKYYIRYNNNAFGYQQNGTSNRVQLYKLSGSVTPPPTTIKDDQNLSFANSQVEWTIGDNHKIGSSYNTQTVSGAHTTVTWTSSNTAVARIENGKIVIVKDGTTTITATAAENDEYYAGSASYTLKINPAAQANAFVKVTSTPSSWDGTYLVVDEASGKAFSFDGTNYAINVTITDGKIALTDQTQHAAVTVSDAGVKHANNTSYEAYDVKTSTGKFVYYSNGAIVIGDTNTKTESSSGSYWGGGSSTTYYYYHTFMLDNNGVQMMSGRHSSGSSKYYIRYNNNAFGYQQDGTSNRVQLYKLSGSVTPVTPDDPDDPQTGDYAKVTSEPSSWAGTYLIVDEASQKVFMPFEENAPNFAYSVTINNGVISANADLSKYAVTITDAGSNHNNSHLSGQRAYDVKNSAGYYIFWSSDFGDADAYIHVKSTNTAENSGTTYTYHHAFMIINGGVQLVSAIDLADGNAYYLGYSNGAFSYTDDSSRRVQLYKLNGSVTPPTPGKTDQNLSFSNSSVTWKIGSGYTMGSSYAMQTLSGAKTSVSYTSSNSAVATISGTQITIKGTGTTTITANAIANDTYNAGSASYTLSIVPQDGSVWNLENALVAPYLSAAETSYTDSNWSSSTVVSQYAKNISASNRGDVPTPVTVTWSAASGSGNYTVSVYNNSGRSDLEMSQTTSSTSADIYNLIPNRTYYYSVTRGSNTVATGSFVTEGRRRMLKVSDTYAIGHANNCRDFGGLKTTDGKTLNYGMIFRGTNMDATTTAEKEYLTGYMKVGLDVDLRSGGGWGSGGESGSSAANNAFNGSYGVEYVCGNFSGSINDFHTTNSNAKSSMTSIFTKILSTIKAGKAAYIHCYVGADRTGYTCMLLEAVLGVSPKDCSIDFELTSFSVVGSRTRSGGGNRIGLDSYNYINGYNGATFKEKAYNILIDYGVTAAQIEEFRSLMLQ